MIYRKSNSSKILSFLNLVAIEFSGDEEEGLYNYESELISLQTILEQPKPANRQNLINDNVNGSNFLGDSITQIDRDFSQLVRDIVERLKASLR